MFAEFLTSIRNNRLPERETLRKRFDFALTKKVGVLQLAPAYWMRDPKINPRADHLLWAALLLKDRGRIDMALSVLMTEAQGKICGGQLRQLVLGLLAEFSDPVLREQFAVELQAIIPELMEEQQ